MKVSRVTFAGLSVVSFSVAFAFSGCVSPSGSGTEWSSANENGDPSIAEILSQVQPTPTSSPRVDLYAGARSDDGSMDGAALDARFEGIQNGVIVGGFMYVNDSDNYTIRKINLATHEVSTFAGQTGVYGSQDGIGTEATLDWTSGIIADGEFLYSSQCGAEDSTIRKISLETAEVTTLAGSPGVWGYADGVGAAAMFNCIGAMAQDGGFLYAVDSFNQVIRKVDKSTGEVTTFVGSPNEAGSDDGTGSAARFRFPWGIAVSGENLFVADVENSTIRKVVLSTGEVSTLAGAVSQSGFADGVGSDARFYEASQITAVGPQLYVADNANNAIRVVDIATGEVTTLFGDPLSITETDGFLNEATTISPRSLTFSADLGLFLFNDYYIRLIAL